MLRSLLTLAALIPLVLVGCRQDAAASPDDGPRPSAAAGAPSIRPSAPGPLQPGSQTQPGAPGTSGTTATGQAQAAGEDPRVIVAKMLKLAETGNWEDYIDRYYGEAHKFRSKSDRAKLVERYETEWDGRVIEMLREVTRIEPQIVDNGRRAVFSSGDGRQFSLYKDKNGAWKYHL